MTIQAKVIADSVAQNHGRRITTMQLMYPRFIHSEFLTHRVFSRNASSSRAIPVAKMLEQVRNNPAMPIHWGKNQAGMQAREELDGRDKSEAEFLWRAAALAASDIAQQMMDLGLHKQVANRILEPFQHIHVIVSATEWDNFFALRDHEDADPNIQALARAMKEAMNSSTPRELMWGEWHLPYVTDAERDEYPMNDTLCRISAARCCRVSYLKHDGTPASLEEELALFKKLAGANPKHMSPLEHQATPLLVAEQQGANFRGWLQFRNLLEN